MGILTWFIAVLLGASCAAAGELPGTPANALVAADPVLEDVGQLSVALAMEETRQDEPVINVDASRLRVEVVQKLNAAGIRLVENEAALDPKLVVRVESLAVPGVDACVCRVQASLDRVVTIPGRKDLQVRAQVWRARPVTEAVARADAGRTVAGAVLGQVEVFVAACQAAHQPPRHPKEDKPNVPASSSLLAPAPRVENPPLVPGDVCLASRGGSVFHRPACRLARKIAAGNLITYRNRLDALQAGLRPCRSCKP